MKKHLLTRFKNKDLEISDNGMNNLKSLKDLEHYFSILQNELELNEEQLSEAAEIAIDKMQSIIDFMIRYWSLKQ